MKTHLLVDFDSLAWKLKQIGEARTFSSAGLANWLEDENYELIARSLYSSGGYNEGILVHLTKNKFVAHYNRAAPLVDIALEVSTSKAELFVICSDSIAVAPILDWLMAQSKIIHLMCVEPHRKLLKYTPSTVTEEFLHVKRNNNDLKRNNNVLAHTA